jgi:nucleotide-binding universal stress UspA family protein
VMRHAPGAVLMLRASSDGAPASAAVSFKRLILPLDGSEIAEQALPHALTVAEITGAQLILLRVVIPLHAPPPLPFATPYAPRPDVNAPTVNEMVRHAESYLARLAGKVRSEHPSLDVRTEVRVDESPARAIVEVARENECDLAVMATHGRGVSRLFVGSVADKVVRGGPLAVLLCRAHHD